LDGKVNSESDSNENSFEIFVADVEQAAVKADPVVEVNGIRIWIQPLPTDHYNLKHDMTLNDFLDLIGILNDPSKQAIYTDPITGATYILNLFDGNMPLVEVLDLIGYDRDNLEQQFLGRAHCIQIIDTTTILQLQDDTTALFHPVVSEEIFYRHGVNDYQRSYFSKKILDAFDIVKLRFQDTFRESIYESAYNIIKTRYSEDFGITQEEWLELVDSKAKDESGVFTQEFEKIVDLCLKEQIFLNLIELSCAQDQDVNAIFSTLDTYLDENFGSLIEQLFNPLTFEAFISEVINQVLNNIDNEGFVSFSVPTHNYFDKLIQKYSHTKYIDYLMELPTINVEFLQERSNKEKIIDFYLLIERINQLVNDMNLEVRDLSVTPELRRLQNPIGIYDQNYFDELFKNNFEAISKYSWFTINRENEVENFNNLDYKEFCRTYLKFIQDNPQLIEKYYWLTDLEFSDDLLYFDKQTDLLILQLLDEAMIDLFSYVDFILLQTGMLNFGKDNLGRFIEFGSHANPELYLKILRKAGLSCLDGIKIDKKDLSSVIRSLIAFGFKRTVEFTDGTTKSYIIHPPNSIFADIFNGFNQYSTDSTYLDRINSLIDSILPNLDYLGNEFFNSFLSDIDILKKILKLPIEIQIKLGKTLDQLNNIFNNEFTEIRNDINNIEDGPLSKEENVKMKQELLNDYIKHCLFSTLLDYYLNYEIEFKRYAEKIEKTGGDKDTYHEKWDNHDNLKRLQRLLWGILTDFRHLLTGQKVEKLSDWLSFSLHHWRTAEGQENKYDCEFLSLIPLPQGGVNGHSQITTEITNNPEVKGPEWENLIRDTINSILSSNEINNIPQEWRNQGMSITEQQEFQDYIDSIRESGVMELIQLFVTHDQEFMDKIQLEK